MSNVSEKDLKARTFGTISFSMVAHASLLAVLILSPHPSAKEIDGAGGSGNSGGDVAYMDTSSGGSSSAGGPKASPEASEIDVETVAPVAAPEQAPKQTLLAAAADPQAVTLPEVKSTPKPVAQATPQPTPQATPAPVPTPAPAPKKPKAPMPKPVAKPVAKKAAVAPEAPTPKEMITSDEGSVEVEETKTEKESESPVVAEEKSVEEVSAPEKAPAEIAPAAVAAAPAPQVDSKVDPVEAATPAPAPAQKPAPPAPKPVVKEEPVMPPKNTAKRRGFTEEAPKAIVAEPTSSATPSDEKEESVVAAAPVAAKAGGQGDSQAGNGEGSSSGSTSAGSTSGGDGKEAGKDAGKGSASSPGAGLAGIPAGEPIRDANSLVPISSKPFTYPHADRLANRTGTASVIAKVRADGTIAEVVLEKSSGSKTMDQEALTTFKKWKFAPGQEGYVRKPVQFVLKGEAQDTKAKLTR